ncbi:MAG: DNA internalization-related competence protein ComEC/Rec2 [Chloroflexi bacterium]|nr:DNA internalization-related competence protein ComEC/Rec2 [Chloroflexota bacterium]
MRLMTLVILTLAWTLGILLGRWLTPPIWLLAVLAALAVGCLLARPDRRALRLGVALALAALLGAARMLLAEPPPGVNSLATYNDHAGTVTVRGVISADPERRSTYTQLELRATELLDGDTLRPVRGKAVLSVPSLPTWEYGDRVEVQGRLQTPPVLDEFDYREYLAGRGVGSVLRGPRVVRLGAGEGSTFLRTLYRWRQALRSTVARILPNPEAGLLSGILLGVGHSLPADLDEAFRVAGLSHIMVISGYNISLVAGALLLVGRKRLNYWVALGLCLAGVAVYALFVGLSAPVLRAALMALLVIGSQYAGRRSHTLTSLAAAAFIMTAANPLYLWCASYQLSFAATLGLVVVEPAMGRRLDARLLQSGDPQRAARWSILARDVLLVTLAAQLATLPVMWTQFGEASLAALPANALVLPVQTPLMLLGAAATALGLLWAPLGRVAAWLVWPLLRYCLWVVETLGGLSSATVALPRLSPWLVWGAYALLVVWLVRHTPRRVKLPAERKPTPVARRTRLALAGLALAAVLIWSGVATLPDRRLHLYALDVGQGDAILLRTPSGRTVLVDGGPDPVVLTARLGRILPFWQRHIDLVVATHADQDHLAGLLPLAEDYTLGQIIEPPSMATSALYDEWCALVEASGAAVLRASQGTAIALGDGLRLEVLSPSASAAALGEPDSNASSLVLRVSMGDWSALLTADIDAETEAALVRGGASLQADLLKVAHHGAGGGSSEGFLRAVDPQVALISVGADNDYGHPAPETLARLAAADVRVLRTDQRGTLEVITDGERCWVRCAR